MLGILASCALFFNAMYLVSTIPLTQMTFAHFEICPSRPLVPFQTGSSPFCDSKQLPFVPYGASGFLRATLNLAKIAETALKFVN